MCHSVLRGSDGQGHPSIHQGDVGDSSPGPRVHQRRRWWTDPRRRGEVVLRLSLGPFHALKGHAAPLIALPLKDGQSLPTHRRANRHHRQPHDWVTKLSSSFAFQLFRRSLLLRDSPGPSREPWPPE